MPLVSPQPFSDPYRSRRYTQNGVLHMLDRNRRIKEKPERFQDCRERFDVIFTVEERIFDQVIEGREQQCSMRNPRRSLQI